MHWLQHPLIKLAFALLCLVFSLSLYSSWRRHQASVDQLKQAEIHMSQLQQELQNVSSQAKNASNSATQEKIIRDELLMQKPGETLLQIPSISEDEVPLPSPSPSPSNWQNWQKVLF